MKKYFVILLALLFLTPSICYADDMDFPTDTSDDLWDNWNTREDMREAKPVSDEEFEKALEQVDKKVNKWKNWAQRRKIPKGQEFNQSNETELLNENYGTEKSDPVICIPIELKIGQDVLPIGHYQVRGLIKEDSPVLEFYQSNDKIAQIKAIETDDDFEQKDISFANWVEINDKQLKIQFGSLDFNAYAVLDIVEK